MIRTITATEQVCALPSIPTHDWASRAAQAIASLSSNAITGILIARIDPATGLINPISTGAHTPRSNSASNLLTPETPHHAYSIQDKLERLSTLGFAIPDQSLARGLVAPISLLHPHWKTTPLGQIFMDKTDQSPIVSIIPISTEHPGFVLISTLAMAHSQSSKDSLPSIDTLTEVLGELAPVLARKAKIALEQVTNPKAWLTDREHEILDLLIIGYSVRIIAEKLNRSAHTVHDHVKNLHKKLDASSRGELIAKSLGYTPTSQSPQTSPLNPIVLTGTSTLAELKPGQPNHATLATHGKLRR